MFLKILRCASILFLVCAESGRAVEAEIDRPNSLDTPLGLDLIFLGIGSPVGFYGADFTFPIYGLWGADFGIGKGDFGDHVTLNARRYIANSSDWSRYFLLGTSYSSGVSAQRDQKDRNGDGEIGMTPQLADAIWLNIGFGLTTKNQWGLRYGFEVGVTTVVADSLRRRNEVRTEPRDCDTVPLCGPNRTNRGLILPMLTPLRVGYSF